MSPITGFFLLANKKAVKGLAQVQVGFQVVIKLLKLVETHVLVIMEPGTKIMDLKINRSLLNMKHQSLIIKAL